MVRAERRFASLPPGISDAGHLDGTKRARRMSSAIAAPITSPSAVRCGIATQLGAAGAPRGLQRRAAADSAAVTVSGNAGDSRRAPFHTNTVAVEDASETVSAAAERVARASRARGGAGVSDGVGCAARQGGPTTRGLRGRRRGWRRAGHGAVGRRRRAGPPGAVVRRSPRGARRVARRRRTVLCQTARPARMRAST